MKKYIKAYLKSLTKHQRAVRLIYVGKRLKYKQIRYLFFNNHPFEMHD